MKINNSAGKPYYTQRNNKIRPSGACTVTSMIAALSAAGYPVGSLAGGDKQPEDVLMQFIMSDPACLNRWQRLDPARRIPPNEWHEVLALGTNRLLSQAGAVKDKQAVSFSHAVSAEDIAAAIRAGGAAAASGRFIDKGKAIDHVVAIVGFDDEAGSFIIDDPWGDFRDGYKTLKGDDVEISGEAFMSLIKPLGQQKKWAHIIAPYGGPDA